MFSSDLFPTHLSPDGAMSAFHPLTATHQAWLVAQYLAFWEVTLPKLELLRYEALAFNVYKVVPFCGPNKAGSGLSKVMDAVIALCKPTSKGVPVEVRRLTKLVKPVALATSIDQGKMKVTMEGEARTSNKYHYTMPLKKNWCPACAKLHEDPDLWACSGYRNMPQTK